MRADWEDHKRRAERLPASRLNLRACQALLASVVHSGGLAADVRFFDGWWFRAICGMMGWDAAWVRRQVEEVGVAPELRVAGYRRDRGRDHRQARRLPKGATP